MSKEDLSKYFKILELSPDATAAEVGRNRIDPEPIHVISVRPEKGIADEDAAHLVPAVVKDVAFPVRMESFARIHVFIQVSSVEVDETMDIGWEVRYHPVEDYTYAILMENVYQVHEILRNPKPAGGGIVANRLITPRTVERMLHDG